VIGDGETVAVARPTVGEALAAAARALEAAGVQEPRREADALYAALVRGATSAAWVERGRPLAAEGAAFLAGAVARRAAGYPQAYAAGRAAFRRHWLRVDERVLIPRPETEGLVALVLEWARQADTPRTGGKAVQGAPVRRSPGLVAADVGTGSGAIAVSLATEGPFALVYAIDASADALQVARGNVMGLGLAGRVRCLRGDLLGPVGAGSLDAVVSNPPYVATAELTGLEPSVRCFEPLEALDGGPDGLEPSRGLAGMARRALRPGGLLALEADARRAQETAGAVRTAGFVDVVVRDDLFERPRYVTALQPGER
jgi:release factor glutamine methyltransferase